MVAALVLLFAFTAGGVILLSRDVNTRVSNRSAAQSIAFQSARAGAQQVRVTSLRGSEAVTVELDGPAAASEARRIALALLDAYDLTGSVAQPTVAVDQVTVTVTVVSRAGAVSATGSAQAQTGP